MRLSSTFRILLSLAFTYAQAASTATTKDPYLHRYALNVFDYVANNSLGDRTPHDFERMFLMGVNATDRAAIMKPLNQLGTVPSIYRDKNALVYSLKGVKLKLEWDDPIARTFFVNGRAWKPNLKASAQEMMADLEGYMKPRKSAWYSALVPEAEALDPVTLFVLGGVASAVIGTGVGVIFKDSLMIGWCKLDLVVSQSCLDLKKAADASLYAKSPALDAVWNQIAADDSNVLAKFDNEDRVCPSKNDGKDNEYRGRIRVMEVDKGERKPLSDWFNVVAKISKGRPTDMIISTEDTDPDTLKGTAVSNAKKLVVHMTFDPTTMKPINYRVPTPGYNPKTDITKKAYLNLNPTQKLSPTEQDQIDNSNDMLKSINIRLYRCISQAVTAEAKAGINPGTPVKPKDEATATTPDASK